MAKTLLSQLFDMSEEGINKERKKFVMARCKRSLDSMRDHMEEELTGLEEKLASNLRGFARDNQNALKVAVQTELDIQAVRRAQEALENIREQLLGDYKPAKEVEADEE